MGEIQDLTLSLIGVEVWMLWIQNQCPFLQSFFFHLFIWIICLSSQFSQQINSVSHFCSVVYFIQDSIHLCIDQKHSINKFSLFKTLSFVIMSFLLFLRSVQLSFFPKWADQDQNFYNICWEPCSWHYFSKHHSIHIQCGVKVSFRKQNSVETGKNATIGAGQTANSFLAFCRKLHTKRLHPSCK